VTARKKTSKDPDSQTGAIRRNGKEIPSGDMHDLVDLTASMEETLDHVRLLEKLRKFLATGTPREIQILRERFGIGTPPEASLFAKLKTRIAAVEARTGRKVTSRKRKPRK
jgi:DNA-directed RNA polymerase sigma subunit (sigma70/sigma32)